MTKTSKKGPGNKGKQINSLHNNAPQMHDDNQRRQPPTPQDIARVQPISQSNHGDHPGKQMNTKGGKKS
ncbi:MAG: hypothetical protein ABIQ11_02685 [Saprospiraceae bacterium]